MNLFSDSQHFISFGAYADIFRKVYPANCPSGIDQKLRRSRYVCTIHAAAWMQEIVAANGISFRVGEKRKGISRLGAKFGGLFRRIHADGHGTDACVVKLFQVFLNASQLEVTEWSPVSAIENQQHRFGRFTCSAVDGC